MPRRTRRQQPENTTETSSKRHRSSRENANAEESPSLGDQTAQRTELLSVNRSSECATFDMLTAADYPVELVKERLMRLLLWETGEGLREVLALVCRIAGTAPRLPLLASRPNREIAHRLVQEIEADAQLTTTTLQFSLQSREFSHRLARLWSEITSELVPNNLEPLQSVEAYLTPISQASTRNLRHSATQVLAEIAVCWARVTQDYAVTTDEGVPTGISDSLFKTLAARAGDVSPAVREIAVEVCGALGSRGVPVIERALNDGNAQVRLAAIDAYAASLEAENDQEATLEQTVRDRIEQMARRDTDPRIRRRALRFKFISLTAALEALVLSERERDVAARTAAADAILQNVALTPTLERDAAKFSENGFDQGSALALGLVEKLPERVWSDPVLMTSIGKALSRTKADNSHRVTAAAVAELLGPELTGKSTGGSQQAWLQSQVRRVRKAQDALYALLGPLSAQARGVSIPASFMAFRKLVQSLSLGDDHVAIVLRASAQLPSQQINPEDTLFDTALELFTESRPSRELAEACASVFAQCPSEELRIAKLEPVAADLRLALATMLGPGGRDASNNSNELERVSMQIQILARFVSVSGLVRLPIWTSTATRPLVRLVALTEDETAVELAVTKLRHIEPLPAQLLLEVYTAARVRDLPIATSLDADDFENVSDITWRAAVSAGVF